ncbi:hypothetical protein GMO_17580 [Gluconobacter morbifer G707]|uniref:Uncharacterized protein n=1 Tax=Gluconobacter morbifer G707 TaxID=1088869 RepID=G6XK29_9PROT|nr:hypothetical protein GMO_17580 [Gluconobacter morbifer G707]
MLALMTIDVSAGEARDRTPVVQTVSVQDDLVEDIGMSAVDRRSVICQVTPRLLHTAWGPAVNEPARPQVCSGGANRLGAGYVRYLATNRVVRPHKLRKG